MSPEWNDVVITAIQVGGHYKLDVTQPATFTFRSTATNAVVGTATALLAPAAPGGIADLYLPEQPDMVLKLATPVTVAVGEAVTLEVSGLTSLDPTFSYIVLAAIHGRVVPTA